MPGRSPHRGFSATVRSSVTGVASTSKFAGELNSKIGTREIGVDFDNTRDLFVSVSTLKLIKSAITLRLVGMKCTADFGSWALNPNRMSDPLWRKMVLGATKRTFYEHFCAGKDLEAAAATVEKLRQDGFYGMLDYGLEHADDDVSCDENLSEFLRTIDAASSSCFPVSFIVVKITAICPPRLLKRVSDLLRWEYRGHNSSINLPWKLKTLPIFSDSSPFYHTPQKPDPLTKHEEDELYLAYERLSMICGKSIVSNVPLLIDAEDTSIQPAIDYFTYSAAIEFTCKGDNVPLLYNTIQAYLKDASQRLVAAKKAADQLRIPLGFKLVRGAYMSSENKFAASRGAESPIHSSIEETHACYNNCAEFLLQEIANGSGFAVLATHNIESGKLAARKASDLGIERATQCLQFAQLYGMAEVLSYGLRNAGFRVSKYLPFGPVEQIIPYLMRRAEENRGMLSTSVLDRKLMSKEMFRRIRSLGS